METSHILQAHSDACSSEGGGALFQHQVDVSVTYTKTSYQNRPHLLLYSPPLSLIPVAFSPILKKYSYEEKVATFDWPFCKNVTYCKCLFTEIRENSNLANF